jgi:hypothetical protein
MGIPLRKIIYCLMAMLVLLQGFAPTFATADITIRCAGEPVSTKPCAHEVYNLATGQYSDLMSMMPCCRSIARTAISSALSRSKNTGEAVSEQGCKVKVVWTSSGRQISTLTRSQRPVGVAPASLSSLMISHIAVSFPAPTCKFSDTGPLLRLSNSILHSRGLRAPPIT